MRMTGNNPGDTIRPAFSRRFRAFVCAAVFAVTGLAVYRWGLLATAEPPARPESRTATATVHLRDGLPAAQDPTSAERQITSDANIYRAVRQLGLPFEPSPGEDPQRTANRAIQMVRRNLRVVADATSMPGEVAISITHTDRLPHYPTQLVNSLAESYADDCRADWKRRRYKAYTEAREASERAERELLEAQQRLDAFSRQPDHPTGPEGGRVRSTPVPKLNPQTPAPPDPPSVDNPEWVEMNQRLVALRRRLAELLIDRTPLHPEVRDTELRIGALEDQLSATPRKIDGGPSDRSPPPNQAPAEPGMPPKAVLNQTIVQAARMDREFQTLKESADRASQAYVEAVRLERQARQDHEQEPRIELDLAQPPLPPESSPPPRSRLLLAALAAGLAVAAGTGMVAAGAAIQLPLTTVEQVRAALPVPVVGTIPETSSPTRPDQARRRRPLRRIALIAGGLTVIAACAGSLLWAWGT